MLFTHLEDIGVDGMLVAPGFGYEAVGEKLFLERRDIEKKFARGLRDEQEASLLLNPHVPALS